MKSLLGYRRNVFSQNGEDGVVAEICRRWELESGWFCEFGAWDGKYGSNTYALLRKGWKGVMIEGEPERFKALQATAQRHEGALWIEQAYVGYGGGENSLDQLLARTPIPRDFEVLSIDIDSFDYQVWQSLANYRPRLVIIEIGSSTAPGEEYVHREGAKRLTSFSAMLKLGQSKDYVLVCHTGNLFFVAREHVERLQIDPEVLAQPELLFIRDWMSPTRMQTFGRKVRNLSWQRLVCKIENVARQ
jgi:hypothetical protein